MVNIRDYFKPILPKKKVETPKEDPNAKAPMSLKNSTPPPTPKNSGSSSGSSKNNKDVEYIRDTDTGKVTGAKLPDGRTFTNLNERDILNITEGYKGSAAARLETAATTQEANTLANQSTTSGASEQDFSQVGQIPTQDTMPSFDPVTKEVINPVGQNILMNAQTRNKIDKIPVLNILNKVTGAIPSGGGIKKAILSLAGENKDFKEYLDDYSNSDNIKILDNEISVADTEIAAAKDLSQDYRYSEEAIQLYHNALMRKQRAYNNYKLISRTDQKAYITDVRNKMTALESYFANGKRNDDRDMQDNLLKAKLGGVVNG